MLDGRTGGRTDGRTDGRTEFILLLNGNAFVTDDAVNADVYVAVAVAVVLYCCCH